MSHDCRRPLLRTALGFVLLQPPRRALRPPALASLHRWLDTWTGVGLVATAMHALDSDLSLIQYVDQGWRATFYLPGFAHSVTSSTGTAFAATPWLATQRAAWETLLRNPEHDR